MASYVLKTGVRGADVVAIQKKLGIRSDGIFGPRTKAAVMDFQRNRGLKVDGIFGNQTRTAMFGPTARTRGPRRTTQPQRVKVPLISRRPVPFYDVDDIRQESAGSCLLATFRSIARYKINEIKVAPFGRTIYANQPWFQLEDNLSLQKKFRNFTTAKWWEKRKDGLPGHKISDFLNAFDIYSKFVSDRPQDMRKALRKFGPLVFPAKIGKTHHALTITGISSEEDLDYIYFNDPDPKPGKSGKQKEEFYSFFRRTVSLKNRIEHRELGRVKFLMWYIKNRKPRKKPRK